MKLITKITICLCLLLQFSKPVYSGELYEYYRGIFTEWNLKNVFTFSDFQNDITLPERSYLIIFSSDLPSYQKPFDSIHEIIICDEPYQEASFSCSHDFVEDLIQNTISLGETDQKKLRLIRNGTRIVIPLDYLYNPQQRERASEFFSALAISDSIAKPLPSDISYPVEMTQKKFIGSKKEFQFILLILLSLSSLFLIREAVILPLYDSGKMRRLSATEPFLLIFSIGSILLAVTAAAISIKDRCTIDPGYLFDYFSELSLRVPGFPSSPAYTTVILLILLCIESLVIFIIIRFLNFLKNSSGKTKIISLGILFLIFFILVILALTPRKRIETPLIQSEDSFIVLPYRYTGSENVIFTPSNLPDNVIFINNYLAHHPHFEQINNLPIQDYQSSGNRWIVFNGNLETQVQHLLKDNILREDLYTENTSALIFISSSDIDLSENLQLKIKVECTRDTESPYSIRINGFSELDFGNISTRVDESDLFVDSAGCVFNKELNFEETLNKSMTEVFIERDGLMYIELPSFLKLTEVVIHQGLDQIPMRFLDHGSPIIEKIEDESDSLTVYWMENSNPYSVDNTKSEEIAEKANILLKQGFIKPPITIWSKEPLIVKNDYLDQ